MIYRKFGNTGFRCSAIGMGTYFDFGWILSARLFHRFSNRKGIMEALKTGLDAGINLIDIAEIYQTEGLVGEAISGYDRESLFISSKVWFTHLRREGIRRACESSLRRLGTRYIDLYMVHIPSPSVPLAETMGAMEELVEEGKIRHIGISNFSMERMVRASSELKKHPLSATQLHYNVMHRDVEKDILPYCERNSIALMAYYPIGHGRLASGISQTQLQALYSRHSLRTPAQLALSYLISKSEAVFPIPRARNPLHVAENAEIDSLLSEDEMASVISAFGMR